MITIKGTSKIKGALDLGGINQQLKTGDCIPLTDEDFSDHTVQLAISMGFITYEKGGILDVDYTSSSIKLRNSSDRDLLINALEDTIRPGQTFTLTNDQVNSGDIRGALGKGMLQIVSSAKPSQDIEESDVRIGNIFDEKDKIQEESTSKSEDAPRYLETNEEILEVGVIDTEDPKPVEKKDIPDPKGKTVVWNPTHDPLVHTKTRTQMEAVSIDKEGVSDPMETNVDVSEISFVDAELDQQRKESHPILKDKISSGEDGIDFL